MLVSRGLMARCRRRRLIPAPARAAAGGRVLLRVPPAVARDGLADHRPGGGGGGAWQYRPLEQVYAVVFLDAIMVKVRDNQVVQNKPAYLAVGIDADDGRGR